MVKCSNHCCPRQLSADCRFKTCDHCREYKKRWRKKPENQQKARDYENSDKGRANRKRYLATPKGAQMMKTAVKRYNASDIGKQTIKKSNARNGALLINKIATKMCVMVNGTRTSSKTVNVHSVWTSSQAIKDHLESTFDGWMNWSNYGKHIVGEPRRWQIGHRIPRSAYDGNDPEDVKNCWKAANLFAQCAKENIELCDRLPSRKVLKSLRGIWPKSWCVGSSV